jgi:hypothetical protein
MDLVLTTDGSRHREAVSFFEKKDFLKTAVIPGALKTSGDRGAGIETCRTPIGRQNLRRSGRT